MALTKSIIHAIMVAMNAKLSPDDTGISFRVMGCLVPASTEQPVLFFILLLYYNTVVSFCQENIQNFIL